MKTQEKNIYQIVCCIVVFAAFCLAENAGASLNEPVVITISESKPNDIQGIDRINDLASFGIPLKDSDNITDVSQLGLTGADVYQFRTLGRYPSGNIKWVLVDVITSVNADQTHRVYLTNGSGNSGQASMVSEAGNTITVNTGTSVFTVNKANFNFLDSVTVAGDEIISSGSSKGIIINDGTREYTSAANSSTITSVEEGGPAKVTIKSTGTLKNGEDSYLYYTVRLFFVRGQSHVKAVVTLRNASESEYQGSRVPAQKPVSEFAVSLKMNISGDPSYILARDTSEISGYGNGYLFQGYAEKYDALQNDRDYFQIVGNDGLNVNGTTYSNEATSGYAQIRNSGHYINAGMVFMGGYWPAGFEIESDGTIEVATYSKRNSVDANIGWGQHQTREIVFEFNNASPQNTLYKAQYPLMGHAGIEHYRDAGAAYGNTTLVSKEEEDNWLINNGLTSDPELPRSIDENANDMRVERRYYWNTTGGFQNDWVEVDLLDWLKTGNSVLLNRAKEAVRFRTDDTWFHSDDFNFKTRFDGDKYAVSGVNSEVYQYMYDTSHMYWESIPLMYYLTGNEHIKESLIDMAEWLDWTSGLSETRSQFRVGSGSLRAYSRQFKALSLLAEFLENSYYKGIIESMARQYVVYYSTSDNTFPGRDYDRGFFDISCFREDGGTAAHALRDKMLVRIHQDTVYQIWRIISDDPSVGDKRLAEDISDAMLGWGYFLMNEFVSDFGGTAYAYYLEQPNAYRTDRGGDLNWFYNHSYDLTGNPEFFEKREGGEILALNGRGTIVFGERNFQSFIYRDLKRPASGTGYVDPADSNQVSMSPDNLTSDGEGIYTLTWTVPAQASRYQIKYSDQPLVENLGFNQETRLYQFDPDTYDNFWAAFNIQNEPVPAAQGQTQSHTIDLQQVMNEFNTYYGLDSSHPRYQTWDPDKTYHFAVKYWESEEADPNDFDGDLDVDGEDLANFALQVDSGSAGEPETASFACSYSSNE